MKKQSESGWSLHCHHDTLLEYCHNYQERVDYILQNKPKHEQAIRLKVFKLLPKEAVKELPKQLVVAGPKWYKARAELNKARAKWDKVGAELNKARAEWDKVGAEWNKAGAEYYKARAEWYKAWAELNKVGAEWDKEAQEAFHKKWCGCAEWNGEEVIFAE